MTIRYYNAGDIVRHRGEFLRNVGWYTDVPKNGLVVETKMIADRQFLTVEWSDGEKNTVLALNVELDPTARGVI